MQHDSGGPVTAEAGGHDRQRIEEIRARRIRFTRVLDVGGTEQALLGDDMDWLLGRVECLATALAASQAEHDADERWALEVVTAFKEASGWTGPLDWAYIASHVRSLVEQLRDAERARDEAERKGERPKCAYCTFGEDADFSLEDLKQHVETECAHHPIRHLKDEFTDLQVAWQQQAERASPRRPSPPSGGSQ